MRRNTLLVVLTVAGAALCWWPVIIEPSLDLPWWLPLVSIALLTCLATTLSFEHWLRFVVASSAGAFAGICVGFLIWWPSDPIAAPYLSLVVPVATLMAALVSLVAGLIVRQIL